MFALRFKSRGQKVSILTVEKSALSKLARIYFAMRAGPYIHITINICNTTDRFFDVGHIIQIYLSFIPEYWNTNHNIPSKYSVIVTLR